MKNTVFLALVALFMATTVHAQSTVDSIEAKYKLLPMPDSLTMEKMFPIVGNYQLNNTTTAAATTTDSSNASAASTLSVMMDSSNKGIVWISGLPQGKLKAYLKQSPSTYRIVSQTTDAGTKVPEGAAIYDSTTKTLNIEIGSAYNESNPQAVFAMNTAGNGATMDSTAANSMNEANMNKPAATTKTKTKGSKTKSKTKTKPKPKVMYYTATKVGENMTSSTGTQQ